MIESNGEKLKNWKKVHIISQFFKLLSLTYTVYLQNYQYLQLFLQIFRIVCVSKDGIFPHGDKASHVSKPSVITQVGLTTTVLN